MAEQAKSDSEKKFDDSADESVISVHKLDADEFFAEEIDAVTESLAGSGNIGYASLQASQKDAAMHDIAGSQQWKKAADIFQNKQPQSSTNSATEEMQPEKTQGDLSLSTDRPNEALSQQDSASEVQGIGQFSAATAGSMAASQLSAGAGNFSASGAGSGQNNADNNTIEAGQENATEVPADDKLQKNTASEQHSDARNDLSASMEQHMTQLVEVLQTIHNITESLNETLNELTSFAQIDESISQHITDISDTIIDVTNTVNHDISSAHDAVSNIVDDTVTNITQLQHVNTMSQSLDTLTDALQQVVDQVSNISMQMSNQTDIAFMSETLTLLSEEVAEIINTTTNILDNGNILSETGDTDGDVVTVVDVNIDETAIINDAAEVQINAVEDLAGDVDVMVDVSTDIVNPHNTDNSADDADVTVSLDNDIVDTELFSGEVEISLDNVESVTGDIDADIDAATDILGEQADPLVNDGAGGTGQETVTQQVGDMLSDAATETITSLPQTPLSASEETSHVSDDADVVIDADIQVAGQQVTDTQLEVTLDPIEDITGDIDIEIDSAVNLLDADSDAADMSGEADTEWTESTVVDGGGMFGDMVGGADSATLPDPSSTVAEGLGALDVDTDSSSSATGGLFG